MSDLRLDRCTFASPDVVSAIVRWANAGRGLLIADQIYFSLDDDGVILARPMTMDERIKVESKIKDGTAAYLSFDRTGKRRR